MTSNTPAQVFPPGDYIREALEVRGWTQADLAKIMNRPIQVVNQIINAKKAITPETAKELAEAFDTSPELWLNLETAFSLKGSGGPRGQVQRRAAIYKMAPVNDMRKRHWIKDTESAEELEEELNRFWGVSSLAIPQLRAVARANRGPSYTLTPPQHAWCRQALRLSSGIAVSVYSKDALWAGIPALRALAAYSEEARKVPQTLANMGIRFLVVEHLPRSLIDGAALWRPDGSPVVALSLRFRRIDSFWHTLCHELAHILNGDKERVDIDIRGATRAPGTEQELVEQRANEMAADMLIPKDKLEGFIARKRPYFYKEDIRGFARTMGVHPGIVVGQLHFRGVIPYSANREMLEDVRDIVTQSALTDGWGHTITGN